MGSNQSFGNLIEVGDVILHSDILTEYFCCDTLSKKTFENHKDNIIL